jgi:hypothetical protein
LSLCVRLWFIGITRWHVYKKKDEWSHVTFCKFVFCLFCLFPQSFQLTTRTVDWNRPQNKQNFEEIGHNLFQIFLFCLFPQSFQSTTRTMDWNRPQSLPNPSLLTTIVVVTSRPMLCTLWTRVTAVKLSKCKPRIVRIEVTQCRHQDTRLWSWCPLCLRNPWSPLSKGNVKCGKH